MSVTLFLSIQNVWRVLLMFKLLIISVVFSMTSTSNRFCNSSFNCLFCFFMIGDDIRAGVDFGCRCIRYLFCSFGRCSSHQIRLLDMTIVLLLLFGDLLFLSLLLLVLIPFIVLLILILKHYRFLKLFDLELKDTYVIVIVAVPIIVILILLLLIVLLIVLIIVLLLK